MTYRSEEEVQEQFSFQFENIYISAIFLSVLFNFLLNIYIYNILKYMVNLKHGIQEIMSLKFILSNPLTSFDSLESC